ncbi:hypothetical protein LCGC14_0429630 [marine sediment metagenome]|uniref:Uncharacterized protein n=1 Tax=marine sediment metagenome TaxID=412755 RepID=A0A0F9T6I2_9ZZZZ
MADFIFVLLGLMYLAWILSILTKKFHFTGSSAIFNTGLIAFFHVDQDVIELPSWIIWFMTVILIYGTIKHIIRAKKAIYLITGIPREEESDEQI